MLENAQGRGVQSYTPFHSAGFSGHEIQQREIVSESRNTQAAVPDSDGRATEKRPCPAQEQQLRQRQPPERQLQQQAQQPLWNNSDAPWATSDSMQTYANLYPRLCEYDNLLLAFNKAKKRKSKKEYVKHFVAHQDAELSRKGDVGLMTIFERSRFGGVIVGIFYSLKNGKIVGGGEVVNPRFEVI